MSDFKESIIQFTVQALSNISNPRLYKSERGFQGELTSELKQILKIQGLLDNNYLLEEEYQKKRDVHLTTQRPDIIFHLPVDVSGAPPDLNNFAVWELKLRAGTRESIKDFDKLDVMFEQLNYSVGIFVNISSQRHLLEYYQGSFNDRIVSFATMLDDDEISVIQGNFVNDRLIEKVHHFQIK